MKRTDLMGLAEIFARNPDLQRRNAQLRVNRAISRSEPFTPLPSTIASLVPEKPVPQTPKYRNKVVEDAEHGRFDSQKEFKRFLELKLMERADEIRSLTRQVRLPLTVEGQLICTYVADFEYFERNKDGLFDVVLEDVKSAVTKNLSTYRIKKKLVKAIYGINVRET